MTWHNQLPYPTVAIPCPNWAMPPEAHSFTFLIGLARSLLSRVIARDGLDMRPLEVRPAVIGRLAAEVAVLASFVRRLLVLMALSMEHGLVDRIDRAKPLARPHGRRSADGARFVVLEPRLTRVSKADRAVERWFDRAGQPSMARGAAPPRLQSSIVCLMCWPISWPILNRVPGVWRFIWRDGGTGRSCHQPAQRGLPAVGALRSAPVTTRWR